MTERAISVDRCDSHGVNGWTFGDLRALLIAPGAAPGGYAGSLRNPCVDRLAKREKTGALLRMTEDFPNDAWHFPIYISCLLIVEGG